MGKQPDGHRLSNWDFRMKLDYLGDYVFVEGSNVFLMLKRLL